MALWIGSPVLRSQTTVVSRWLVMPMAAMSPAFNPAWASAARATSKLARPNLPRVMLDPAGLRENLPELLLGAGANGAAMIKDNRPGTRRSLVKS